MKITGIAHFEKKGGIIELVAINDFFEKPTNFIKEIEKEIEKESKIVNFFLKKIKKIF